MGLRSQGQGWLQMMPSGPDLSFLSSLIFPLLSPPQPSTTCTPPPPHTHTRIYTHMYSCSLTSLGCPPRWLYAQASPLWFQGGGGYPKSHISQLLVQQGRTVCGRLSLPWEVTMSNTSHTLLQCDLALPHQVVESNSPPPGSELPLVTHL